MPYVCVLGLLPALYGFSGYDGSAHLAEETMHASTVRSFPPTTHPLTNALGPVHPSTNNQPYTTPYHTTQSAPRSMIFTVLSGGAIGLVYILGLAFATADIPKVIDEQEQTHTHKTERARCALHN